MGSRIRYDHMRVLTEDAFTAQRRARIAAEQHETLTALTWLVGLGACMCGLFACVVAWS